MKQPENSLRKRRPWKRDINFEESDWGVTQAAVNSEEVNARVCMWADASSPLEAQCV